MQKYLVYLALVIVGVSPVVFAKEEASTGMQALQWRAGPAKEVVAKRATLATDSNLMFLDEVNSKKFLELTGNIPEEGHNIVLSRERHWWAAFAFNPMGYVRDNEKIDADGLLKQIKSSDEAANKERKKLGFSTLHTEGWYVPPHYDPQSKRLEWGLKLNSDGKVVLNYTVRLLGRNGVMSATLVSDPENLEEDKKAFKAALQGFEFSGGERYSEFRDGDKVAAYGLGALIAGGAAAVATKKGFWAVLAGFLASAWKFIAVGVAGAFAGLRALFKRNS